MNRISRSADLRACRRLLREGSRSFHAASLLLPRRVRDEAGAVYAWCRVGDHAVDRQEDPERAVRALEAGLERTYSRQPAGAVERAFAGVVADHGIPRGVPAALLEGFRWDAEGRRYDSLDSLVEYCVRVGSTVGVMMSLVMDRGSQDTLRAASRLGVAMQLTNIARDVGEDARMGRLYLPRHMLSDLGVDPEAWLARPEPTPGVRTAVEAVLEAADTLYAASWSGIETLPGRCRPAIRAAAVVYAEIGSRVRAAGCDSVTRRAWTGRADRIGLVARAAAGRPGAWTRKGTGSGATGGDRDRARGRPAHGEGGRAGERVGETSAAVIGSTDRTSAFLVELASG